MCEKVMCKQVCRDMVLEIMNSCSGESVCDEQTDSQIDLHTLNSRSTTSDLTVRPELKFNKMRRACSWRQKANRGLTCLLVVVATHLAASGRLGDALRMLNLDVPEFVSQGDTIHLSCFYSLQNSSTATLSDQHPSRHHSKLAEAATLTMPSQVDKQPGEAPGEGGGGGLEPLYAIKWYKDGREFFRYTANDEPKKRAFPSEGITVDVAESNDQTLKLMNVSLKTSGLYKCEVSTDAPFFVTKFIERKLSVYSMPNEGPVIEFIKPTPASSRNSLVDITVGDRLELLCRSHESKPGALLDWIINDSLNLTSISASGSGKNNSWLDIKQQTALVADATQGLDLPSSDKSIQTSLNSGPRSSQQTAQTISRDYVPGTDHLVEKSSSVLKLTVDSNLVQLLGIIKSPKHKTRSAVDNQAFILISSNPIQVNQPNATNSKDGLVAGRQVHEKIPSATQSRQKPKKSPKKANKGQSSSTYQDTSNHLAMIEIKCTATILQLQMSDKIRIQLTEKQKTDDYDGKRHAGALQTGERNKEVARSHSSSSMTGIARYENGLYAVICALAIALTLA